jgi:hypothetical protein
MAMAVLASCTTVVTGSAVKAPGGQSWTNSPCQQVLAPLVAIDQQAPGEPRLRIPQPRGWQRTTLLDSKIVRYALVNRDLVRKKFAPNAVVTLESSSDASIDQTKVLDRMRAGLIAGLGATDLAMTATTRCGYRAQSVTFTAPPMGHIPARRSTMLAVVGVFGGKTYAATLTVGSADPENPTFAHDAHTILTGFQMVPPGAR